MFATSSATLVPSNAEVENLPSSIQVEKPITSPIMSDVNNEKPESILAKFPEYASTSQLDTTRATEYPYLDQQDHVYLDYTGSSITSNSQIRSNQHRLTNTLSGNPHSVNPTSQLASTLIQDARTRILQHFNASPAEYTVIFTPNASAAAKLVGESYPFAKGTDLVMTVDNHNSIVGLREFARAKGARTRCIPISDDELRIDTSAVQDVLSERSLLKSLSESVNCFSATGKGRFENEKKKGLFAYPAQSNFSGVRHPLSWIPLAQDAGYDVLLDTAAYLPTSALDLRLHKPDFLTVSWYKIFGFPTGIGCLLAKRTSLARLHRPWFSGGTVDFVSVKVPWHKLAEGAEAWEDGTLNFLSIPDVIVGLDFISSLGLEQIGTRVRCLTGWFLNRLLSLRHSNGQQMARIYGPQTTHARGGTVAFNLLDAKGLIFPTPLVAAESAARKISIRNGCFCNPGLAEHALAIGTEGVKRLHKQKGISQDAVLREVVNPNIGCLRVSFGLVSNEADVERFLEFLVNGYQDRILGEGERKEFGQGGGMGK